MADIIIVVPARFGSARFPGKPLTAIRGAGGVAKPLVQRSWEAASRVRGVSQVIVATDDARIAAAIPDAEALRHADRVVRDADLTRLLDRVDAVHVLTSLTGFEALMRRREVVVHGHPFYAGWGLTRDLAPQSPRRGRTLELAELVAATLILYPLYLDPRTGLRCGPEELVAALGQQRPGLGAKLRRLGGGLAARWRRFSG